MKYRIVVQKSKNRKWFWDLVHKNGHVLAHSEMYSSRAKAVQTAETLAGAFKRGTCWLECEDGER